MFINRDRIVFASSMEALEGHYFELSVHPEHVAAARALKPIYERRVLGRCILLFNHAERRHLDALGDVRNPSVADLFVALMSGQTTDQRGNTQGESLEGTAPNVAEDFHAGGTVKEFTDRVCADV